MLRELLTTSSIFALVIATPALAQTADTGTAQQPA